MLNKEVCRRDRARSSRTLQTRGTFGGVCWSLLEMRLDRSASQRVSNARCLTFQALDELFDSQTSTFEIQIWPRPSLSIEHDRCKR